MRIRADFNGLFSTANGLILCLSHSDFGETESGDRVELKADMNVTAFDEDLDENGQSDDLIASGRVVESPEWLKCSGSKWSLIVDENGCFHESDRVTR